MTASTTRPAASAGWRSRIQALASRGRSLLVYLSFSSASNAVGLVTTLFMVRHVAPTEFGRLSITLGALLVANAVVGFGADNLVAINKTNLAPAAYDAFRTTYSHFALTIFAIAQAGVLLAWAVIGRIDGLVLLVPLMALTKFFVTMASIEYVMEQRAVAYGLVQFLTSLAAAAVTVALVLWVSPKAESRIAALILADLALLAVRYGVRPTVIASWRFDREAFLRIARFGAPLMLSIGPAYLLNESDKLVVAHEVDLAAAGVYGAACTIAGFMLTFIQALLNAMVPRIMAALKDDGGTHAVRIAGRYAVRFCALTAAFGAVFLVAYTLLAHLLLPARYAAAIPAVYLLVAMMLFRCYYVVIGTATDYFGMTYPKLVGIVVGAAVTLGSTTLAVHAAGLLGAAAGVGLGYAALGSWLTWSLMRRPSRIAVA